MLSIEWYYKSQMYLRIEMTVIVCFFSFAFNQVSSICFFAFSMRFADWFTCKIVCVQCPFQLSSYTDAWGNAFNRKELEQAQVHMEGPSCWWLAGSRRGGGDRAERQTPFVQIPKISMQTWAGLCVRRTLDVKNMFVDNGLKVQFSKEASRKRHN